MKILAINSSLGDEKKFLWEVIDLILDTCVSSGTDIEKVELDDYDILCCSKCYECLSRGECCKDDDYIHLKAKMLEADGIIVGSCCSNTTAEEGLRVLMERLFPSDARYKYFTGKYLLGVIIGISDNCTKRQKEHSVGRLKLFNSSGSVSDILYIENRESFTDEELKQRAGNAAVKLLQDISEKSANTSRNKKGVLKEIYNNLLLARLHELKEKLFKRLGRLKDK